MRNLPHNDPLLWFSSREWELIQDDIPDKANYVYSGYGGRALFWAVHQPLREEGRIFAGRDALGKPCKDPTPSSDRCIVRLPLNMKAIPEPVILWVRTPRKWWETPTLGEMTMARRRFDSGT